MRLLFVSKRWHLWRYRAARWLLQRLTPLQSRLSTVVHTSGKEANALNDKARMRLEVCKRCPAFTSLQTCNKCGCFMPAKVQLAGATCPQKRW